MTMFSWPKIGHENIGPTTLVNYLYIDVSFIGSTYSVCAIYEDSTNKVIPNGQGARTTPSAIGFTHQERLIGQAAVDQV